MKTKEAAFWLLVSIPLACLLLLITTPAVVLYPIYSSKNIGSFIGPSIEKKLLSWKRQSYGATRNIWQAYCTEYDKDLLYIPINSDCRFANLEYDTYVTFDNFSRSDVIKDHRINILVIGDSFAMGWGVNNEDTFAYRLEQTLNVNVVNAAVSSYGTARQLQYSNKFLRREYDLLVVQYCDNDLGENLGFLNNSISYPRPKSSYESMRVDEPIKIPSYFHLLFNMYVQLYGKIGATNLLNQETNHIDKPSQSGDSGNSPVNKRDWSTHSAPFLRILRLFRGQFGNPPILVTYANSHNSQFINFPKEPTEDNIHFLAPQLTGRDYFVMDAHLNEAGHANLAESLTEYIALHFGLSRETALPASTNTD